MECVLRAALQPPHLTDSTITLALATSSTRPPAGGPAAAAPPAPGLPQPCSTAACGACCHCQRAGQRHSQRLKQLPGPGCRQRLLRLLLLLLGFVSQPAHAGAATSPAAWCLTALLAWCSQQQRQKLLQQRQQQAVPLWLPQQLAAAARHLEGCGRHVHPVIRLTPQRLQHDVSLCPLLRWNWVAAVRGHAQQSCCHLSRQLSICGRRPACIGRVGRQHQRLLAAGHHLLQEACAGLLYRCTAGGAAQQLQGVVQHAVPGQQRLWGDVLRSCVCELQQGLLHLLLLRAVLHQLHRGQQPAPLLLLQLLTLRRLLPMRAGAAVAVGRGGIRG